MKLIGNLKKQVEETKNKEEAKEVIEKAGMQLTDDELDMISGGQARFECSECGEPLYLGMCKNRSCPRCPEVSVKRNTS